MIVEANTTSRRFERHQWVRKYHSLLMSIKPWRLLRLAVHCIFQPRFSEVDKICMS